MNPPFHVLAGNILRFVFTFKNESEVLADPTTVVCKVGTSDLDAVSLSVTRDSTGTYHADWDTTDIPPGAYYCKCTGSGALVAVKETLVRITIPHITS